MTGKQMIRKFLKNGWTVHKTSKGSHYQLKKNGHFVVIPYHVKEIGSGLQSYLLKIFKEVG